jgi:hypothetical protein
VVARAAACQGLFLLVTGGAWEFLSARTGRSVLCWFEADGTWTTAGGAGPRRGKATSAFSALRVACRKWQAFPRGSLGRPS